MTRYESVESSKSEEEDPGGDWVVDSRTGKSYKRIPPTEMDEDNRPVEQLDDFDEGDLDGEALKYLSHLR